MTSLTIRVKQLEDQVAELEAEASRLLRAHDQVKEAKAEEERAAKKRLDDAARESANQVAEIDNLRAKVKQYADYDEIKRELEIMKVSNARAQPLISVCRVLQPGPRRGRRPQVAEPQGGCL